MCSKLRVKEQQYETFGQLLLENLIILWTDWKIVYKKGMFYQKLRTSSCFTDVQSCLSYRIAPVCHISRPMTISRPITLKIVHPEGLVMAYKAFPV